MSKCWIDNGALNKMRQEGMMHFPLETGGSLMGYITKDGDVVIVDIIGPGSAAVHERRAFSGDYKWIQSQIEKIYDATDGMITYLGDWHTHPDGPPIMSDDDKAALDIIIETPEAYAPCAIMAILAFRCDVLDVFQYPDTIKPMILKQFDYEGVHA